MQTLRRHQRAIWWVSVAVTTAALLVALQAIPFQEVAPALERARDGLGLWAPVVYALCFSLTTVCLLPGSPIMFGAGALFGFWLGLAVMMAGGLLGACIAFVIGRTLARRHVKAWADRSARLLAIEEHLHEEGWRIVTAVRILPLVPFNVLNYLLGVTGIRFRMYFTATAVSMLPLVTVMVYAGHLGRSVAAGGVRTPLQWGLIGGGAALLVYLMIYLIGAARQALTREIDEHMIAKAERARAAREAKRGEAGWRLSTAGAVLVAIACIGLAWWTQTHRESLEQLLTAPAEVTVVSSAP